MKQIVWAMVFVLLAGMAVQAQSVPPLVNYQGLLTDAAGKPQTGTKKLEFNLYDAATGGNKVWGPQVFNSVPLVNGMFNVILGTTDAGGKSIADAFSAKDRYLGMKVDTGTELVPRQQILSTPFAINAQNAENAKNADNANLLQNKSLSQLTSDFRTPDYDSGWFDIAVGNTYKKEVGFTGLPKFITAYYKLSNGQVFAWGLTQLGPWFGGYQPSGVILDFDENGSSLYVRAPSGNYQDYIFNLGVFRSRSNDSNENILQMKTGVQFRVLLWK